MRSQRYLFLPAKKGGTKKVNMGRKCQNISVRTTREQRDARSVPSRVQDKSPVQDGNSSAAPSSRDPNILRQMFDRSGHTGGAPKTQPAAQQAGRPGRPAGPRLFQRGPRASSSATGPRRRPQRYSLTRSTHEGRGGQL